MAKAPQFASAPRSVDISTISTANTNRDGTGTIATIATGSANGFKVNSIVAKHEVTSAAGMVRIYISNDSGSTWNLFDEIEIAAITPSATLSSHRTTRNYTDLVLLGTSNRLGAAPHNAESINMFVLGADL